jgi:hypothetical protein
MFRRPPVQNTLKVPVLIPPFEEAEIFTAVELVTEFVSTLKFTLELPAKAVTELGIEATALTPLTIARLTTVSRTSVCGNITVPVVLFPPATEFGANVSPEGVMAVTVKEPFFVAPFALAEIVTGVVDAS